MTCWCSGKFFGPGDNSSIPNLLDFLLFFFLLCASFCYSADSTFTVYDFQKKLAVGVFFFYFCCCWCCTTSMLFEFFFAVVVMQQWGLAVLTMDVASIAGTRPSTTLHKIMRWSSFLTLYQQIFRGGGGHKQHGGKVILHWFSSVYAEKSIYFL
jgi:hypothetical protein